jgi:branched-chain amino acid transport system substrate-binding protein
VPAPVRRGAALVPWLALAAGLGTASTGSDLLAAGDRARQETPAPERPAPWKQGEPEPVDFRGPGRSAPEPDVAEVVLGWFGPAEPDHPEGGDFWRGATLALEEENRAGGYEGKPFRLLAAWSDSPWAAGIADVTRLVYDRGVWALLGAISGASTHLAEQVALKSWVSLVSAGSTDDTTNEGHVPWLFSCLPSDGAQAPVLVDALESAGAGEDFVVAAAAEHDAHATLVAIQRELAARRLTPRTVVEFDTTDLEAASLARHLVEHRPGAVLVLAPAGPAGRVVAALRRAGFRGTVLGGATLARTAFVGAAGSAAEGVVVPRLWEPSAEWDRFTRTYEARWGEPPDYAAGQAYDSVRLVADAVRRAGLNRARIRDALRALSPWTGVTGVVRWDAVGRNRRPVGIARWAGERLVPTAAAAGAGRP